MVPMDSYFHGKAQVDCLKYVVNLDYVVIMVDQYIMDYLDN